MLCLYINLLTCYNLKLFLKKQLKNRKKYLNVNLVKKIDGNKVVKVQCKVYFRYEENFEIKGYSKSWINNTTSVQKDNLEKHVKIRFNIGYYLGKNEYLCSEFGNLLALQEKNVLKTIDIYGN